MGIRNGVKCQEDLGCEGLDVFLCRGDGIGKTSDKQGKMHEGTEDRKAVARIEHDVPILKPESPID